MDSIATVYGTPRSGLPGYLPKSVPQIPRASAGDTDPTQNDDGGRRTGQPFASAPAVGNSRRFATKCRLHLCNSLACMSNFRRGKVVPGQGFYTHRNPRVRNPQLSEIWAP